MKKDSRPLFFVLTFVTTAASAGEPVRLCDFESERDLKAWDYVAGRPALVKEGATHGKRALAITFDPKGKYHPAYIYWRRVRKDWSGYDALVLDVTNPGDRPLPGYLLVGDAAWAAKGSTYWNRHNAATTFPPGRTRWVIPTGGLYRGEAGSRNNDIKRNIDVDAVVRVDFGFGKKGATGRVIIDNLRLVRSRRPAGVRAFDFGPPDQGVMLGWTGVSHRTAYTPARGYGWGPAGGHPWNGAARDTTFGPPLIRDFCAAGGYRFRVDVPAGACRVMVIYENAGYWGGEQARHATRTITAGGKELWSDRRKDGAAHALWRFEDIEPVGRDIWETYLAPELARPVFFDAAAGSDGLTLHFATDKTWGSKIAALAVCPADDAAGNAWLRGQIETLADTFRGQAVCLDEPAGDAPLPAAWAAKDLAAWAVTIEQTVTPHALPPADIPPPAALRIERTAVRGETETACLAVRPARDLPELDLAFRWTGGPGPLPAAVNRAWYNTSRGFGTLAYHIRPHTLRPANTLAPRKGVTRQVVVRVTVPADAKPGRYTGRLSATPAGAREPLFAAAVVIDVRPVTLDRETDFRMGFFGLMPPNLVPEADRPRILEETLAMLRAYGMNIVSGGPGWRLEGWKDGKPVIDFAAADRFFALLKKHGFTGAHNGYGGCRFAGLHGGYEKGPQAAQVEKQSGLPYAEALVRAWRAVHRHARQQRWPTIWYAMCDETRVRDAAERQLAFMKLMARVSAAFPETVRTAGSYSVHFRDRPADRDSMLYWHQRFFAVLDISDLNIHDDSVMQEARKRDKEIHIYNQGRSRWSFGPYQFSEYRKGIRARTQWHLNILHGYQFFDLDGREPDTAMICYGRNAIYPTVHFERCREGAEDFYLFNTLRKRLEKQTAAGAAGAAVTAAEKLLAETAGAIPLNRRTPPAGYDPRRLKERLIAAIEALGDGGE